MFVLYTLKMQDGNKNLVFSRKQEKNVMGKTSEYDWW